MSDYGNMKDYQQRVIQEHDELITKINKLEAFIEGDVFKQLDETERGRLVAQEGAMRAYAFILIHRIAAFTE